MGTTKTDLFSAPQNQMASLMKALGHPARIAIIEFLLKTGQCICGDIVNELPLAQPTISQHLKELKAAGLIMGNVEGAAICYCIDPEGIKKINEYFGNITNELNNRDEQCC
ncbi:metalloregulator ArsR/SmtB family transcription factor [uncultured Flavobacterium sp.]|uniref:ArsR/SmtB family transcription factor n=1 Tax=uncultured Flavobacterium sp. TaxID=165435 RepID=UPI0025DAD245|nr:metalloregulator ArsR/SmtB family transcription factor [uncultured Flavobacterium sp.]